MKLSRKQAVISLSFALTLTFLLLIAGCASVSVRDQEVTRLPGERGKPEKIVIRDFDISHAELNVDRTGDELEQFKANTVEALSKTIVSEMLKFYPAESISANAPAPTGNALLIEGRITRINQGSRALRMVVGFGAGGTKMETTVTVYDASTTPAKRVLAFDTTGGSGAEPGITSPDPVSAGASAAAGAGKGVSDDTKRTARMIAYRLSQYLGNQGWISPEQIKESKKLGE